MGWKMARTYDRAWADAAAAQKQREAELNPTVATKFKWTDAEIDQAMALQNRLLQELQQAKIEREKGVQAKLKEIILSDYTTEAGQPVADRVAATVAKYIALPLEYYNTLSPILGASTDAQKKEYISQEFQRYKNKKESQPEDMYFSDDVEIPPWTINDWNKVVDRLKDDVAHLSAGLDVDTRNRLFKSKEQGVATVDVIMTELKLAVTELSRHKAVVSQLLEFLEERHFQYLADGKTKKAMDDNINVQEAECWFTRERAAKARLYFDSEEKVAAFQKFWRSKWSRSAVDLQAESELVESLASDREFLGTWLNYAFSVANKEGNDKVYGIQKKLQTLRTEGREALKMNL